MSDKVDAILKKSIDDVARDVPGYRSVLTRREAIAVARRVLALFPVTAAALFGSRRANRQKRLGLPHFVLAIGSCGRR